MGNNKLGYKMNKKTSRIQKRREMKKKPANAYPKFAFRVDAETKEELLIKVDAIYCFYLDRKEKNQYTVKKNDILIEALRMGLEIIEKDVKKLPLLKNNDMTLAEWQRRNPKEKGSKNTIF